MSVDSSSEHRNEQWWHEYGGRAWQQEYERRRPSQPHYSQQEAFLQGFFLGMPATRVLDFGCGFGRHLKALQQLPWLDLYGCDISEQMVQVARADSGLRDAERRIRQISPRGRLPFDDNFFDVAFTSEVLIHIDSDELPQVLAELWRVSRSLVLHIENSPVDGSFRENDAHGGCWKHDFASSYRGLAGARVQTLSTAVDLQGVYLVTKPSGTLGHASAVRAEAALEVARTALARAEAQLEVRAAKLSQTQIQLEDARRELGREWVPPSRLQVALSRLSEWRRPAPSFPYADFASRGSLPPAKLLAARPDSISICHPEWRGIRAATYAQSPYVIELTGIASQQQGERAVTFLRETGTRKVVINGYPPQIEKLVTELQKSAPEIEVFIVYHGAPAQDHYREDLVMQHMLDLVNAGAVKKLGFVKAGLAEYFQLQGYPAQHVTNRFSAPSRPASPAPRQGERFHVGVFAPNISHKNVVTQILAGLMIPDSIVEVCELPPMTYLGRARDRLRIHGILPHPEFMHVLGQVDASLYVSHSECYPMTVLESLAAGVVCLTSHTSELFNQAPELSEALVVAEHDNPRAIADQLGRALQHRVELVSQAQRHLQRLDQRAAALWNEFVGS